MSIAYSIDQKIKLASCIYWQFIYIGNLYISNLYISNLYIGSVLTTTAQLNCNAPPLIKIFLATVIM